MIDDMHVLIVKSYSYANLASDPRFSFEIAFRRLNAVLEVARGIGKREGITILVPEEEIGEAKKRVDLEARETILSANAAESVIADFDNSSSVLIIDEQAIYASPELISNVVALSSSRPCTWEDPDRLLWSFNYHDSCRFMVAPVLLIKKHFSAVFEAGFSSFQNAIFGAGEDDRYTVTPADVPSVYRRAVRFNPYPYHYYLEPTSRCNSSCIMCPFHSPDPEIAKGRLYLGDGGDDMPLETFKRLVDEIASVGWDYLPHYRTPQVTAQLRGEPTLAPNYREMFSYVKERGLRLSFSTNGSTLHKDGLADFLLDIGTDEIVISIDGDREEYSKIRPALDYDQVVESIRNLAELRERRGGAVPVLYTKRVRLSSSSDEADRLYVDKFSSIVDWAGIAIENFDDFRLEGKGFTDCFFEVGTERRLPCIWVADVSVVKSNGKVDMCFGAAEHYIGDVKEKPLLEILRESPLRRNVLHAHGMASFDEISFCAKCTSWKANYNRSFEEDDHLVNMNPVMAYWKRKRKDEPSWPAGSGKQSAMRRILSKFLRR